MLLVAVAPFAGPRTAVTFVALATLRVLIVFTRLQPVVKLASCACTYRTVRSPSVTLHHTPALRDPVHVRALLWTVETELHALARRFGRVIRTPVTVYLTDQARHVAWMVGRDSGGFALCEANSIVLAADTPWEEFIRHELAHLYAGRWSRQAPPLLEEGLAVWLQGTQFGRPIDDAAREVLSRRDIGLNRLRDREWFFDPANANDCYTLAGSFTGFLIRRFGWAAYERLYRLCDGRKLEPKFQTCFGQSPQDADWEWRLELRMGPA